MGNCITSSNIGAVKEQRGSLFKKYTYSSFLILSLLSILNILPQNLYIFGINNALE